jgi:hydroxymethylpyrimidine pyrophosphatase-like HAD family hydrolase
VNVAIDLDGTLAEWSGDARQCGEWIPGAKEALRELIAQGHRPIIHTCRAHWEYGGGYEEIERFLDAAGFVSVLLWTREAPMRGTVGIWMGEGKPIASAYVDDRAVFFNGSWTDALSDIERRLSK